MRTTTSLVKVTHQMALPIHLYPASLAVHLATNAGTRASVIAVLIIGLDFCKARVDTGVHVTGSATPAA
jgi:hypothetical protein